MKIYQNAMQKFGECEKRKCLKEWDKMTEKLIEVKRNKKRLEETEEHKRYAKCMTGCARSMEDVIKAMDLELLRLLKEGGGKQGELKELRKALEKFKNRDVTVKLMEDFLAIKQDFIKKVVHM